MSSESKRTFKQDTYTAFYINMDKDKTRHVHCEQLLNDIGFDTVERIIPIDINDPILLATEKECTCTNGGYAFSHKEIKGISSPGRKYHGIPHGIKSLTHTHKRIWQRILEQNTDDYFFIFEDDIELVSEVERFNFLPSLINDIQQLPELNDMMYLGCCLEPYIIRRSNFDPNSVSCWGTHAYMINRKGIQFIYDHVLCYHQCSDFILRTLFKTNILGHQYCCPYNKGHIGYLFQGREEKWYSQGMADELIKKTNVKN